MNLIVFTGIVVASLRLFSINLSFTKVLLSTNSVYELDCLIGTIVASLSLFSIKLSFTKMLLIVCLTGTARHL